MDSQAAYRETSDSNTSLENSNKTTEIKLSKAELQILRECNKESFYYRCLPFALIGMGATYYGLKTGYLSSHPRFGGAFKLSAAAFCGWLLGKVSYRKKCEDKFINVENSTLGYMIRKKRGYVSRGSDNESSPFISGGDDDTSLKGSDYTSYSSGDFHSSSRSLNFDKNEPSLELDDRERPTIDSGRNLSDESQAVRQFNTYDDLRRKNREDYEKQQYKQPEIPRSDSFRRPWNPSSSEPIRRTSSYPQEDTSKNTYGDSWDNPKFS